jgi:hypothetical protein
MTALLLFQIVKTTQHFSIYGAVVLLQHWWTSNLLFLLSSNHDTGSNIKRNVALLDKNLHCSPTISQTKKLIKKWNFGIHLLQPSTCLGEARHRCLKSSGIIHASWWKQESATLVSTNMQCQEAKFYFNRSKELHDLKSDQSLMVWEHNTALSWKKGKEEEERPSTRRRNSTKNCWKKMNELKKLFSWLGPFS